ncbi:MAG: hypothetical protein ACWA47_05475 [Brevirhabdus sp.]
MRVITPLVLAVTLAGCAATGPAGSGNTSRAKVEAVYLYDHTLNVLMSDGSLCAAPTPRGAGKVWSGTLSGCEHPLPFTVELAQRVNPFRLVLEKVGLSPVLHPMASVTITEASGRSVRFVSPPPEAKGN